MLTPLKKDIDWMDLKLTDGSTEFKSLQFANERFCKMPITVPNNEKTLNKDINFFPQPLTLNIQKNPYSKSTSSAIPY